MAHSAFDWNDIYNLGIAQMLWGFISHSGWKRQAFYSTNLWHLTHMEASNAGRHGPFFLGGWIDLFRMGYLFNIF